MKFLTKTDLASRWNVTKQVIHNWSKRHIDFPAVAFTVDHRGTPLFTEADVQAYERKRNLVPNYYVEEQMTVKEFEAILKAMKKDDRGALIAYMCSIMGENNFLPIFKKALETAEIKIEKGK